MLVQFTTEGNSPRRAGRVAFEITSAVLVAVCVLAPPMAAEAAVLAGSQSASPLNQSPVHSSSSGAALLAPGRVIQSALAGGQSHAYEISLSSGQYAGLVVEQEGLDVVVQISDPASNK